MCIGGEDRMFREIRGIEDETILSAIHRLPAFYFQGGWADGIRVDFFGLPAGGEEALRITREGGLCRIGFRLFCCCVVRRYPDFDIPPLQFGMR